MAERRTAVVTGVCGYVASHLAKTLDKAGWRVFGIDRAGLPDEAWSAVPADRRLAFDGHDFGALLDFTARARPTAVFHLAAAFLRQDTYDCVMDVSASNLQFSMAMLDACHRVPCCVFVNTGSHWQHYRNADFSPVDAYAATKRAFQVMVESYVELHGLRATTLTLFDPYGEDDRRDKLIPNLVRAVQAHRAIDISAGEQEVDFVHVDDVSAAYVAAFELLASDKRVRPEYGVSAGRPRRLRDLLSAVLGDRTDAVVNFGARPYRRREVMTVWRNFETVPGWSPRHDVVRDLSALFRSAGGGRS